MNTHLADKEIALLTSKGRRQLIEDELEKDQPDWHLIERLSRGEVDADEDEVRFSVDAGHVQRLGMELVAKQETALAELVKNSYDADASIVKVTFRNHDKPGGTLVIEDNGIGMNFDVVRDAWMRISTTSKHNQRESNRYGRARAGRKGIGRFAVQRLGKMLVLETEVKGATEGLRVRFDWDTHFTPGQHIQDVFNQVERYEKPIGRERTCLRIFKLREKWTANDMGRVWKAVLLLQSPFKANKDTKELGGRYTEDPGFEVFIDGVSSTKRKTELSFEKAFFKHAIAEISGEINSDGAAYVRLKSDKLNLDEKQAFDNSFLLTGPIAFSTYYFIYHKDTLSGLSMNTALGVADEFGGVRIYRNGFRVPPYGDPTDDWLRLELDTGRRAILAPARNRSFFGQVELDENENPLFDETSSREGFIENEAFEELRFFVRKSIEWAVRRVAAARDRKQTAGQKDFTSKVRPKRRPSEVFEDLANIVETLTPDRIREPSVAGEDEDVDFDAPATRDIIDQAMKEVAEWEEENEQRHQAALRYEEMLRILASLGLSVTIFGHEIKGVRNLVGSQLHLMNRNVLLIKDKDDKTRCVDTLSDLKHSTGRMFDLGGYIAGLMSNTESRDLQQISLKGAIDRFAKQFDQYMERQNVHIDIMVDPINLRTTDMHISELDSVLLNFMTNSIKSMKRAKINNRRIKITAQEEESYALIRFEDNGGGIPPEIEDKIFDAFFTTTMGTGDDEVSGPGAGLGLRIVSDIAVCYGGSVRLNSPSEGYNCCFEFRVLSARSQLNESQSI